MKCMYDTHTLALPYSREDTFLPSTYEVFTNLHMIIKQISTNLEALNFCIFFHHGAITLKITNQKINFRNCYYVGKLSNII